MTHVDASIHINRPREEVFAYVEDNSHDMEWREGLIETRLDGPHGVGGRITEVAMFLGQKMETVSEITAYEPPTRIVQRSVGGPFQFEGEFRFEEMGGGTHVSASFDFEAGGFFKLAEGMVASQAKKQIEGDFARLKAVLEA